MTENREQTEKAITEATLIPVDRRVERANIPYTPPTTSPQDKMEGHQNVTLDYEH